jgi:hypothetical protein
MRGDADGQRHWLADRRFGDGPLQLTRDGALRQMKQEIQDPRRLAVPGPEQAIEEGRDLWPDAWERRERGKEWIEEGGTK